MTTICLAPKKVPSFTFLEGCGGEAALVERRGRGEQFAQ